MANQLIEKLKDYGCDTDGALERFVKKEELYLKFLKRFPDDPSFAGIKGFIDAADYENALKSVHTLKGVAGNLGLTPLYTIAADMVTKFRADMPEAAVAEYDGLAKIYNELYTVISEG